MKKLSFKEISEKYAIERDQLTKISNILWEAFMIRIKGQYRPIDDSETINKIISERPRLSRITHEFDTNPIYQIEENPKYQRDYDHAYQNFRQVYGIDERHPIKRISFKLASGEILSITDPATIEGIRQGLEKNQKHILKSDAREAHRPKSEKKARVKKAIELTLSFAPDGSDNSKYLFVGNIFADMGYVKNYEAWDNDPGGFANYNEYLTSFIKNALFH
jgi:hypothetical protein